MRDDGWGRQRERGVRCPRYAAHSRVSRAAWLAAGCWLAQCRINRGRKKEGDDTVASRVGAGWLGDKGNSAVAPVCERSLGWAMGAVWADRSCEGGERRLRGASRT